MGANAGFGRADASVAAGCAFLVLFTLSSEIEEEKGRSRYSLKWLQNIPGHSQCNQTLDVIMQMYV